MIGDQCWTVKSSKRQLLPFLLSLLDSAHSYRVYRNILTTNKLNEIVHFLLLIELIRMSENNVCVCVVKFCGFASNHVMITMESDHVLFKLISSHSLQLLKYQLNQFDKFKWSTKISVTLWLNKGQTKNFLLF